MARVALLERNGVAGTARAGSWLTMLAPITGASDDGAGGFSPRLARYLVAGLTHPRTRDDALALLDTLIEFGRGGDPGQG